MASLAKLLAALLIVGVLGTVLANNVVPIIVVIAVGYSLYWVTAASCASWEIVDPHTGRLATLSELLKHAQEAAAYIDKKVVMRPTTVPAATFDTDVPSSCRQEGGVGDKCRMISKGRQFITFRVCEVEPFESIKESLDCATPISRAIRSFLAPKTLAQLEIRKRYGPP